MLKVDDELGGEEKFKTMLRSTSAKVQENGVYDNRAKVACEFCVKKFSVRS